MLTRLKVDGFKNLDGVDVRFGPFTCIVGGNGVGKSNLFDAIKFLSALADRTLVEAAAAVRGAEGRVGDVKSLFRRTGQTQSETMSFLVEMIIPAEGTDDLGAKAVASMTYLKYQLTLGYREDVSGAGPLEVVFERMEHINKGVARATLGFSHSNEWRDSVIKGRRTVPYIATDEKDELHRLILTHADSQGGNGGGGARKVLATNMPRTALSTANSAVEQRTLVLARKEMMGWTQFQLEPSALRAPDPFNAPRRITSSGAHLPASLHALARGSFSTDVYQDVANRLDGLFENVLTLKVDEDHRREQLAIVLTDKQGTEHLASSLSDGTLRFLALSILEAGTSGPSLLCMEEPENGIHPERIGVMVRLLLDIAVDPHRKVDLDNPMRQVIVNTHSPEVTRVVPADSLVFAKAETATEGGTTSRRIVMGGLPGTWRFDTNHPISIRDMKDYLPLGGTSRPTGRGGSESRLMDRQDAQQLVLSYKPSSQGVA